MLPIRPTFCMSQLQNEDDDELPVDRGRGLGLRLLALLGALSFLMLGISSIAPLLQPAPPPEMPDQRPKAMGWTAGSLLIEQDGQFDFCLTGPAVSIIRTVSKPTRCNKPTRSDIRSTQLATWVWVAFDPNRLDRGSCSNLSHSSVPRMALAAWSSKVLSHPIIIGGKLGLPLPRASGWPAGPAFLWLL
jgi:hypothetical protein